MIFWHESMSTASQDGIAAGIPVRNAWHLLLYAWDLAAWQDQWYAESEDAPSLLGLLASMLSRSARRLLRRQMRRSFSREARTIRGIRGRVDFTASLKHLAFENGFADCTFPELTIDTLPNRIIRSTLARLAAQPLQALNRPDIESDLRHELRALVRAMDGVQLAPITPKDFSRLQLGRNDRDYALPIAICRLIHTLRMPTEKAGDEMLAALLRDEITFHELFERFVRNFYRLHMTDCVVGSEQLQWHDELGCGLVPAMITDVSIVLRKPPFRRLVVDTKYSVSALAQSAFGTPKFKSENLYQLYSYLRTQEHRSDSHRAAAGLLLYPTNGYSVHDTMLVQGHRITVSTVDLSRPWQEIEVNLLSKAHSELQD